MMLDEFRRDPDFWLRRTEWARLALDEAHEVRSGQRPELLLQVDHPRKLIRSPYIFGLLMLPVGPKAEWALSVDKRKVQF